MRARYRANTRAKMTAQYSLLIYSKQLFYQIMKLRANVCFLDWQHFASDKMLTRWNGLGNCMGSGVGSVHTRVWAHTGDSGEEDEQFG